jgi:hypothetical protein
MGNFKTKRGKNKMKILNIMTSIIVILVCLALLSKNNTTNNTPTEFVKIIHTQQEKEIIQKTYKKESNYSTMKINRETTGYAVLIIHFLDGTATEFCPAEYISQQSSKELKSVYDFWVDEYYDYTLEIEQDERESTQE